jgi:hypothetical protein
MTTNPTVLSCASPIERTARSHLDDVWVVQELEGIDLAVDADVLLLCLERIFADELDRDLQTKMHVKLAKGIYKQQARAFALN